MNFLEEKSFVIRADVVIKAMNREEALAKLSLHLLNLAWSDSLDTIDPPLESGSVSVSMKEPAK